MLEPEMNELGFLFGSSLQMPPSFQAPFAQQTTWSAANPTLPSTPGLQPWVWALSARLCVLRLLSRYPWPETPPAPALLPTAHQPVPTQVSFPVAPVMLKCGSHPLLATEIPPTLSPSPASRKSSPGARACFPGRFPLARHGKGWFHHWFHCLQPVFVLEPRAHVLLGWGPEALDSTRPGPQARRAGRR